jgi:UTP--glucose-1-phosphate uridylyltransferase
MRNITQIRKAVFPVAGLGTRFLPATKAQPKEMLTIVDKPLIQYAVEEAYEAGIRHMIFVTGRSKRAIEDHFDTAYELEAELEAGQKHELLKLVRSMSPPDMVCSYVRQPRSLGLGHAVLCAAPLVGDEPFAVLLADDLMTGAVEGQGVLRQMVDTFGSLNTSILAVQEVPAAHVNRYGIVAGDAVSERLLRLTAMVEKPSPEQGPFTPGCRRAVHPDPRRV